ncbi:unnamed protein product [Discosporangium mesarthrocarpum]
MRFGDRECQPHILSYPIRWRYTRGGEGIIAHARVLLKLTLRLSKAVRNGPVSFKYLPTLPTRSWLKEPLACTALRCARPSCAQVVSMALGFQHVLVLCESGAVYGWGKGERGQLGSGEHNERTAVRVALPGKAVAIGSGFSHGVAILETGEAYVWGKMQSLDVKSLEVPVPVHHDQHQPRPVVFDQKANLNGSRVTKVACGSFHTILRLECGRSFMFGMQADTRHMVHTPIEVTKPFSLPPVGQSSGINETPVLDEEGRWTILSLKREGPCLSPLDLAMGTGKNHESVKAISLGWKHAVALVE